MVDPSVILALRLQREELEAFTSQHSRGGHREISDENVAVEAYRAEIERMERSYLDRRIAENLSEDVRSGIPFSQPVSQAKKPASPDLDTNSKQVLTQGCQRSTLPKTTPGKTEKLTSTSVSKGKQKQNETDLEVTGKLVSTGVSKGKQKQSTKELEAAEQLASKCVSKGKRKQSEIDCDAEHPAKKVSISKASSSVTLSYRPSSTTFASKASSSRSQAEPERPVVEHNCGICREPKPSSDVVSLPCEHYCCRECTPKLFQTATADESRFPPRCCGKSVPLEVVKEFLTPAEVSDFKAKSIEFSTKDRVYCSEVTCNRFIPPRRIEKGIATCSCRRKTCVRCKGKVHIGKRCLEDEETQKVLDLAKKEGWKHCTCGRLIEITTGCNHMT